MEIIRITCAELQSFAESKQFSLGSPKPITKHKAASQALNPLAGPDDLVLICAYVEDQLMGYAGALPDIFKTDAEEIKLASLSGMWVSPDASPVLATVLLRSIMEAYDYKVYVIDTTDQAAQLYEQSGLFLSVHWQNGMRYYSHPQLANRKRQQGRNPNFLDSLGDFVAKAPEKMLRLFNQQKLNFTSSQNIDFELEPLNQLKRTGAYLEWVIQNPWILKDSGQNKSDYYFSAFAKEVKMHVTAHKSGHLLTHLINRHLKVPFYFGENHSTIAHLVYALFMTSEAQRLTLFDPDLINAMNRFQFIFRKQIKRRIFLSKELKSISKSFIDNVRDGDGDGVFW